MNNQYRMVVTSLEQTIDLGVFLASFLAPQMIITLEGDLGAGKTTFTSGIALGLGINKKILSPSFNIMRCYFDGRIPLFHIDAYRLEDGINKTIGLEEYIDGDGLAVIEWPKFISEFIPEEKLAITIEVLEKGERLFTFTAKGNKYQQIIDCVKGVRK